MKLKLLSLTNFRGFKRLEVEFADRWTLILGDNAQGKTSILEAIHFLSILTSPQAANDRQLIHLGSINEYPAFARIHAVFDKSGKDHQVEIRLILNELSNGIPRLQKEVYLDNNKKKIFESVGFFTSVLFLPQMIRIIDDSPENRRRYLDEMISQAMQGYIKTLSDFQKALSQRNALLKQLSENQGDYAQLDYWDNLLADTGSTIIHHRWHAISRIERLATQIHYKLSNSSETLEMFYYPSLFVSQTNNRSNHGFPNPYELEKAAPPIEEIHQNYAQKLIAKRKEDIARGLTTIGPHRDDIRFFINNQNVAFYGSRGQIRTTLLSLKLAEIEWLHSIFHEKPVILLDEIMAELDEKRRNDLVQYLLEENQAILTTADLDYFSGQFLEKCCVLKLQDGRIS